MEVSLDAWHVRAGSIVNYQASLGAGKMPTEEDIQEEFARLVAAELRVGREAVLFLRTGAKGDPRAPHELVGILHDDPEKEMGVDHCEQTIRKMIEEGAPRLERL